MYLLNAYHDYFARDRPFCYLTVDSYGQNISTVWCHVTDYLTLEPDLLHDSENYTIVLSFDLDSRVTRYVYTEVKLISHSYSIVAPEEPCHWSFAWVYRNFMFKAELTQQEQEDGWIHNGF